MGWKETLDGCLVKISFRIAIEKKILPLDRFLWVIFSLNEPRMAALSYFLD